MGVKVRDEGEGQLGGEVEERGPTSSRANHKCAGAGEEGDEVGANNGESMIS